MFKGPKKKGQRGKKNVEETERKRTSNWSTAIAGCQLCMEHEDLTKNRNNLTLKKHGKQNQKGPLRC